MSSLLQIDTPYLCHIDLKISSLTAVTYCRLELQPVVTKIPKCDNICLKGVIWKIVPKLSLLPFLIWSTGLILSSPLQSTLVISKSKGPSEILRDIRTSTYQICRTEENTNQITKFHKWTCNLTPLVKNVCWKYCGKWEKLLLRSNFTPYPQFFNTWC